MDLAIWEAKSMPWIEVSVMDQRGEFVRLAMQEGANRRELCRRIPPATKVTASTARRKGFLERPLKRAFR
jgi:hypothetical protein